MTAAPAAIARDASEAHHGPADPDDTAAQRRVLSVSARQPASSITEVSPSSPPPAIEGREALREPGEVFLTPRVLNQRSLDALGQKMRALVEEAAGATEQLQERLRLGARMLKALQGQIERVEGVLAETERRRQDAQQAEERVLALIAQLEAAAEPRPRETASQDLEAVTRRLEALVGRLNGAPATAARTPASSRARAKKPVIAGRSVNAAPGA